METGDRGAGGGHDAEDGNPPPSPPGWNPLPPGGGWPQPPGGPAWAPPPPPASPPGSWAPPPPPGAPPGGWPPPPPGYPPNAAPGAYWNPGLPATTTGLRPRGVGELLDGAFSLYRRNFLLLVAIAAVVQVPFAIVSLVIYELADIGGRFDSLQSLLRQTVSQGAGLTPDQQSQLTSLGNAVVAYSAAVLILQFLIVYPLSQAATTTAVSARYLDQPTSVAASYRAALSRWRSLIALVLWLTLLVAAPVAVGLLLSALTGSPLLLLVAVAAALVFYVVLLIRTTVAPQAVVLEKLSGWQGIRRSVRLTEASAWRIFGIRLLLILIQSIASAAIALPVVAAVGMTSLSTQQVVSQVAQAIVSVFVAPITLVTLTLLYYDLRIRREGFDIEMLAASL